MSWDLHVLAAFGAFGLIAVALGLFFVALALRDGQRLTMDLERGRIAAGFPETVKPIADENATWKIQVSLSNIGRSAATVKQVAASFFPSHMCYPEYFPDFVASKKRDTDSIIEPWQAGWRGILPFETAAEEGKILLGHIIYEDIFGQRWRTRFAVRVWSTEAPGRHYYHPFGGPEFHSEERI
jgi:hypothetical protein